MYVNVNLQISYSFSVIWNEYMYNIYIFMFMSPRYLSKTILVWFIIHHICTTTFETPRHNGIYINMQSAQETHTTYF